LPFAIDAFQEQQLKRTVDAVKERREVKREEKGTDKKRSLSVSPFG
jgi:hypothetical protein